MNAWNRNFIPPFLLVPQGVSRALRRAGGKEIFGAAKTAAREHGVPLMVHIGDLSARRNLSQHGRELVVALRKAEPGVPPG